MEMQLIKKSFLLITTFSIICSCKVLKSEFQNTSKEDDSVILEQRILLKEFSFCNCLAYGYKNTDVSNDISLPIYYNKLLYGQNIVDSISKHAKEYADQIPASDFVDYDKQKPIIAACLYWYKSKKLDSLVNSYDKSLVKSINSYK